MILLVIQIRSPLSLSRAFLQLVPVRLFGTGQLRHQLAKQLSAKRKLRDHYVFLVQRPDRLGSLMLNMKSFLPLLSMSQALLE